MFYQLPDLYRAAQMSNVSIKREEVVGSIHFSEYLRNKLSLGALMGCLRRSMTTFLFPSPGFTLLC